MTDAYEAAALAARDSYGRLLAWLISRCRDIALAEDVLGDALESALSTWPARGVPDNPEAWLLTAARRKLIDRRRRAKTRSDGVDDVRLLEITRLQHEAAEVSDTPFRRAMPDRRLELLFLCAHPDVPAPMRTPLMLQTVLGLTAERIGAAMLVAPKTVGQRLVRLKRRLADATIPMELPGPDALEERVGAVLESIYAAYGTGWEVDPDLGDALSGLAGEAIWLARLVVDLLPGSAEARGLYALLCHCEARRGARRDAEGRYVPLEAQDPARWDPQLIEEAEKALWSTARLRQPGHFQAEAAIQSLHAHRAVTGRIDWAGIHWLYETLANRYPSTGASIGYAASFGRIGRPAAGLEVLDALPEARVARHQPYWAVRAWLLRAAGDADGAHAAYGIAIGLCQDPAVRAWLVEQQGLV